MSDEIPSEASYSRMIALVSESDALEIVQERTFLLAMSEKIVSDETVAIDAIHVEARDRVSQKKDPKAEKEPKKRAVKRKKNENSGCWKKQKKVR